MHFHIAVYTEHSAEYIIASACINIPNIQPDLDPLQAIICFHEGLLMEWARFNSGCAYSKHQGHRDCDCLCSIPITLLKHCEAFRQTVPLHLRNQVINAVILAI